MSKITFTIILLLFTAFGLSLRLIDYDRIPPFGETRDEFLYPWAGISLLTTGVPKSWSFFYSYPQGENVDYWGVKFRLVTPWLEKPPLYSLLTGGMTLLAGEREFGQVRLSTIRLIPIVLSLFTLALLGLYASEVFNYKVGVITTLLYATVPTIVLGNRMSLTENLMVPLSLLTLYLFEKSKYQTSFRNACILGILCGLATLNKQIGIVLPFSLVVIYVLRKQKTSAFTITLITLTFAIVNPLMGYFSNWQLYQSVTAEFMRAHSLGLPETIATLFRTPGIGHKESIFYDGAMLVGFVLFFSSPFWLRRYIQSDEKKISFLLFPFFYITGLCLLEGGTTWYGWHLFPLYPYIAMLLGLVIYELWQKPDLFSLLTLQMIIGASSLRFLYIATGDLHPNWQWPLFSIGVLSLIILLTPYIKLQRIYIGILFGIMILINVYTVIHLSQIYPISEQPIGLQSNLQ